MSKQVKPGALKRLQELERERQDAQRQIEAIMGVLWEEHGVESGTPLNLATGIWVAPPADGAQGAGGERDDE